MTSGEALSLGQRREAQAHLVGRRARHFEDLLDVGQLHHPASSRLAGLGPRGRHAARGGAPVGLQQEAGLEGLQGEHAEGVALQGGAGATGLHQREAERAQAQAQGQPHPSTQVGRGHLLGQAGGWRLHRDHLDAVQVSLLDLLVCGAGLHLQESTAGVSFLHLSSPVDHSGVPTTWKPPSPSAKICFYFGRTDGCEEK